MDGYLVATPPKPWAKQVNEEIDQTIEIHNEPNQWLYGALLFLAASAVGFQPNRFGLILLMIVLVILAGWWLARPQSVIISFGKREATFTYSSMNSLRRHKVVSIAGFSRVYASPFYKNGGWSIHLSGPRGEHLLLAQIPSPWQPTFHNEYVRGLCAKISAGLRISDGGGG